MAPSRRWAGQVGAGSTRARDGAGALATPTAAGMALKAWEGIRGAAAAVAAPSWCGLDTPAPVVLPSSQAFVAAALRLAFFVRPQRL